MTIVRKNLFKVTISSAFALASLLPTFADTTNLKYQYLLLDYYLSKFNK